jgi:hypothetical protein
MPAVGFEPTISAGERPQTNALDRAVTGTGLCIKTNWRGFDYVLCESSITRMECITNLVVLIEAKLHFHQQVDNIFSQAIIRLLGLIRNVTFSFSSLHSLLKLLEYASIGCNSTSSDVCKLKHIHRRFVFLCHHRLFNHLD